MRWLSCSRQLGGNLTYGQLWCTCAVGDSANLEHERFPTFSSTVVTDKSPVTTAICLQWNGIPRAHTSTVIRRGFESTRPVGRVAPNCAAGFEIRDHTRDFNRNDVVSLTYRSRLKNRLRRSACSSGGLQLLAVVLDDSQVFALGAFVGGPYVSDDERCCSRCRLRLLS